MATTEERIASRVINECLGIKGGDVVIISTYPHTIPLANAMALECYRQDADPLTVLDTDEVFYGHMNMLSEESLRTTSEHCLGLADYTKYYIWLGGPEDPAPMRDVPSSKFSALFEGEKAHWDKNLEVGNLSAGLALGQVTPERARAYGFDFEAWKRMVEDAIEVSPKELSDWGRKLEPILGVSGKVRVTAPNGTDLRFELGGRTPQIFDGILDEEDMKRGSLGVGLPSGDVEVAILEQTAEGTVLFDVPTPQLGVLIKDMRWVFEGGRLVKLGAGENEDAVRGLYEGASGDKDRLGSLTVGVNPKAKTGFLDSAIPRGAVTLGIGDNRELGGKNESDWGFAGTLSRATLVIDGTVVVKEGSINL
ncbi:MAG: aminopeptidase [Candidatus Thermoplasmatota archaeon]|nr:aminopeptidase [Candidatus Thermoplasmatota archaeon]